MLKFYGQFFYENLIASSKPTFTEKDYPDLTGKKWLVTGATGGIGLEVVKLLLSKNADVWLVGRSETKLDNSTKSLQQNYTSSKVHTLLIDYNDLATVKPAVEKLRKEVDLLDGIIHNAGILLAPEGSVTEQGIEQTIGVNAVAPGLLQDLLDPLIENVPNGRIVWLSSGGQMMSPTNGFDPNLVGKLSPGKNYFMSKALEYIMAVQWTKRHPNSSVKSVSVHPGVIKSDLSRNMPNYQKKILSFLYSETIEGAKTVVASALDPNIGNNLYLVPYGKPGVVRPDIVESAHGKRGADAVEWVESKIASFR